MYVPDPFRVFDPLGSEASSNVLGTLESVANRARALLRGRTSQQIYAAANTIDLIADAYFERERYRVLNELLENDDLRRFLPDGEPTPDDVIALVSAWPDELEWDPPAIPDRMNASDLVALKADFDTYDFDDMEDFPSGAAHEYGAVLALRCLGSACSWDGKRAVESILEVYDEYQIEYDAPLREQLEALAPGASISVPLGYAFEALDAVCWAEHIRAYKALESSCCAALAAAAMHAEVTDALIGEKVAEKISMRARKAAAVSQSDNHKLRDEFFAWCDDNFRKYKSLSRLAEAGLKVIPVRYDTLHKWAQIHRRERVR